MLHVCNGQSSLCVQEMLRRSESSFDLEFSTRTLSRSTTCKISFNVLAAKQRKTVKIPRAAV